MSFRVSAQDIHDWVKIVNQDIMAHTSDPDQMIGVDSHGDGNGRRVWRIGKRNEPFHAMAGMQFSTRELFFYLYGVHSALSGTPNNA